MKFICFTICLLLKNYEINCKTYKYHSFSRRNFQGQNVLILPEQNVSICFASNIYIENIGTVQDKKLCMKTWYNSKAFVNFIDFSCVIFWVQNFLIPPNHTLLLVVHRSFSLNTVHQYFNNVSIYFQAKVEKHSSKFSCFVFIFNKCFFSETFTNTTFCSTQSKN